MIIMYCTYIVQCTQITLSTFIDTKFKTNTLSISQTFIKKTLTRGLNHHHQDNNSQHHNGNVITAVLTFPRRCTALNVGKWVTFP